jgi:RNA polymerase sigma-70 factor (ECF subfamily)
MSAGIEDGLKRIDDLGHTGALDQYYLFHAARADLLRRMNRYTEAASAYERAACLATNSIELDFLKRRLRAMRGREIPGGKGSAEPATR